MQEISARKKLSVIRHYLRGDSYDVTAARTGVSKGGVAGIISDLKAGLIPEVQEPAELIDPLREVAVECRKANITPERAIIGLTVLSRLQELQIEPAEIDRWATVYRQLGQDEARIQAFIRTALLVEEVRGGSRLTIEELEARVQALQKEVTRLEPAVKELRQCEKSLQNLQKREKTATAEAVQLENRRDAVRVEVASKEKREAELTRRVEALEQRAWSAEEKLAAARNGLKLLGELGLSPDGLSGLAQRLSGIAQRHGIQPEALRDRLLSELERLEDCLTLEATVEVRKHDLARLEQEVSVVEEQRTVETSAVKDLRREKVRLEKAVQDQTALLRREIADMTRASRDATDELTRGLSVALAGATAPVEQLRDKALELGRELGQYQAIIDSSEHIRGLSSLITGNSKLTAGQTRVIMLAVMRPAYEWMKMNMSQLSLPKDLMTNLDWCIKDLEKWQT